MKNENNLVPRLRFPEFKNDGEWKESLLSEISPVIFDGTHQTPTYTEEGIPFFSVENIISGNKNKYISREDYLFATLKNKPEKGDIIITRIGNIGTSKVIDWDYEFSIYVTLAVVKKSPFFESYYLHSYFQSNRYQKEILSKSLLNAVPCKINMDELRRTKILLPPDTKKKEQQRIASCLSSLDEVITAESQKLELLKEHKKGLLQNLFPQEGETIPRLRFKEFKNSGEWEVESLGNLAENLDSKRIPITEAQREKGKIPYYGASGIIDFVRNYIFDEELLCISEDGANLLMRNYPIAFSISGKTWVNNHAHVLRFDKSYTQVLVETYLNFINLEEFLTGMAQPKLNRTKLDIIPIPLPKNLKEQQKIASCLSSLDECINAQAEKIEQLKLHKKGLLQGLFPQLSEL